MTEQDLMAFEIKEEIMKKYFYWFNYMNKNIEFSLDKSVFHTKKHSARVLLLSLQIGYLSNFKEDELDSLALCAIFHDSRRLDDSIDTGHGERAAVYYKEYCKTHSLLFNEKVFYTIKYHDLSDNLFLLEMQNNKIIDESYVKLFDIFKDADALDRFRFGLNGLKLSYLRTNESFKLINLAKDLNGL